MTRNIKLALAVTALLAGTHAFAQITFYEGDGFHGRAFTTARTIPNLARTPMNDRTSSLVVDNGRWEVCSDANFKGRCVVVRQGKYESLQRLGLENNISSARPVNNRRQYDNEVQPAMDTPDYAWRRRANERVYEAPVTYVHAVMGPATQHCWVERQQVADSGRGDRNVGGALAGALIGGVLGHQVGGGTGKDLATVGGAVAGGVIGSNIGRDSSGTSTRDVQRCQDNVSGTPAYWDVAYNFRGVDHHLQMSAAPGTTIAVNGNGEPRQ
jgi:uncharacterized protein YcfJ